jgi:cyclic-di-AMP phosphodiesterase PgpH
MKEQPADWQDPPQDIVSDQEAKKNSPLGQFIVALALVMTLFICFHFREVRVDALDSGSKASRYIVAQTDFDFPDEEATIILRQESVNDISKIYQINPKQVKDRRTSFGQYLRRDQKWRKNVEYSSYEEMSKISSRIEEVLLQARFIDSRTLQKMQDLGLQQLESCNYYVMEDEDFLRPLSISDDVWNRVAELVFAADLFQENSIKFILNYFQIKKWNMEEDRKAYNVVKQFVQANVLDQYTPVFAGDRIVDQGERVTKRHLDMLQAMKVALRESRNLSSPLSIAGSLALSILFTLIGGMYLHLHFPKIMCSLRRLSLVVTIVILNLGFAKFVEVLLVHTSYNYLDLVRYPVFVPFAALLISMLVNVRVAIFSCGFLAIVMALTLVVEWDGFLLINLLVSIVVVLSSSNLRKRKDVFKTCLKGFLVALLASLSWNLYEDPSLSSLPYLDIASAFVSMMLMAVLVIGFVPLLEMVFNVMTNVTLVEFLDPNHELLKRLSIEAPGTYQHSLVVGNLAEAAAIGIGCNGLFCRVTSLYHDIGKLMSPHYFTENQQGGINMHHLLTPLESAQVIIGHVEEGVLMASAAGLPQAFIDVIKEHHGDTLVYYFFHKQSELMGGDESLVDKEEFRYPGPKPQNKESAVIMIADSVEAASRSLDEFSEESVERLVKHIIKEKADSGQFDNSKLTFEDLYIIKKIMVNTLVVAGHTRIKYPERSLQ